MPLATPFKQISPADTASAPGRCIHFNGKVTADLPLLCRCRTFAGVCVAGAATLAVDFFAGAAVLPARFPLFYRTIEILVVGAAACGTYSAGKTRLRLWQKMQGKFPWGPSESLLHFA